MLTSLSTLLMGFAVLTGVVDNPPEDLLSLGSTEKILTTLNIEVRLLVCPYIRALTGTEKCSRKPVTLFLFPWEV